MKVFEAKIVLSGIGRIKFFFRQRPSEGELVHAVRHEFDSEDERIKLLTEAIEETRYRIEEYEVIDNR